MAEEQFLAAAVDAAKSAGEVILLYHELDPSLHPPAAVVSQAHCS